MKQEPFKNEFNKMFKPYTNKSIPGRLRFDKESYNKFLNFFLFGNSFYFIINHHMVNMDFVSEEVEEVLGYHHSEFDIAFLNTIIHPEDRSWFLGIGNRTMEFFSKLPVGKLMKYKVRYDIRMIKKNGEYARMLYQGILLEHDLKGRFLRTLNMLSDITYLKQEGKPILSFIGMNGEVSYQDVASKNIFIESKDELTKREREVLKLLIEGRLSKEISQILKISKQTVDTHRKNMLCKKKLNNTSELVGKAIRYGWI
jgi:DNA-binding CsgD family transcriptional regulator